MITNAPKRKRVSGRRAKVRSRASRLRLEPLEERTLLSLSDFLFSPAMPDAESGRLVMPPSSGESASSSAVVVQENSDLIYLANHVDPSEFPLLDRVGSALLTLYGRHLRGQSPLVSDHAINNTPYEKAFSTGNGLPHVQAFVVDVDTARPALEALGMQVSAVTDTDSWQVVAGYLPVENVQSAAHVHGLINLMPTPLPSLASEPSYGQLLNQGAANSQWDELSGADQLRRVLNVDGTGIDVGVMSDSIDQWFNPATGLTGIDDSRSSGDLPPAPRVTVLADYSSPPAGWPDPRDEGRAMAEHVYDLGAGFDIIYHTAAISPADMAQGITDLRVAGADVIVDDITWWNEPFFQDGQVVQRIDTEVSNNNVLYFDAAGNMNDESHVATWSDPDGDNLFNFSGTDETVSLTLAPGESISAFLQWDEAWGSGATDFDIELWDAGFTTLLADSNDANIGGNPFDNLGTFTNPGPNNANYQLAIRYVGGAPPVGRTLKMFARITGLPLPGPGFADPYMQGFPSIPGTDGAAQAIVMGAVPFWSPNTIEDFSSHGPVTVFFDTDGNRLSTPVVRAKPDFTAADGCNTTFFGEDVPPPFEPDLLDLFPNFFGTSAAAPNAAAVAGLMLEAAGGAGSLSRSQVSNILAETAVGTGTGSWDAVHGWGRINALGAGMAAKGIRSNEFVVELNQFGNGSYSQSLSGNTDTDRLYFAVDVAGGTTIDVDSLTTGFDPAALLWRLPTTTYPEVDYDDGPGDDPRIDVDLPRWTVYQVEVFSESDLTGIAPAHFDLHVNGPTPVVTTVSLDANGDASLSNQTLDDDGDADYYEIVAPLSSNDDLTVVVAPNPDIGPDVVASLYDDAGNLLVRKDVAGAALPETLKFSGVVAGATYVVRVGGRNYASLGSFSVGIDFDTYPLAEYYYATDFDTGNLVLIDPATELVATVGTPVPGQRLAGLALTNSGALYGHVATEFGNDLYEIDRLTGVGTLVGPIGMQVGSGLGYDPVRDRLYTVTATGGVLVRISRSTGDGTTIGSGVAGLTSPTAAAFDTKNDRLIVFDDFDDQYWAFDPTTGAATLLSTSSMALNTDAMAYTGSKFVVNNDNDKRLLSVNPDTGSSSPLLTPAEPLNIWALEYVGRETTAGLLGIDFEAARLYDVGRRTGAASNPRPTRLDDTVGIAFADDHTLYTLTGSSAAIPNSLFQLERSTGTATLVGPTGLSSLVEGDLDFDPTSGILYGIGSTSGSNQQLFRINRETGAATVIGPIGTGDYSAMAFSSHGSLYVLDTTSDQLLRVNKSTAAILSTKSLSRSLGDTAGMDFDPETGILYVVDGGGGGTDVLYSLSTSTGKLTPLGATGLDLGLAGLEFVPYNGAIRGTKFNDSDGDGRYDTGEVGLAGWDVFLDYDQDGALDAVTTTTRPGPSASLPDRGSAQIPLSVSGLVAPIVDLNVSVSIYHPGSSIPGFVSLVSPSGTSVNLTSSLYSGALTFDDTVGNAAGLLSDFDGQDPNGTWYLLVQDGLADGLAGTVVTWSLQFTHGEQVATTDAFGNYVFGNLKPDTYTVAEVHQTGWIQTFPWSPDSHRVVLNARRERTGIDFGNFEPADIRGTKWDDLDGDGVRDPGEKGLSGWGIYLDHNDNGELDPITTTNRSGTTQEIPDGAYFQSNPIVISGLVGPVVDLNVTMSLVHNHTSGQGLSTMQVVLVGPMGAVDLFGRNQLGGNALVNTTFDDEAATSISDGTSPYTGSFQAEGMLAAFDGTALNGPWYLTIDEGPSDGFSATLSGWSIEFTHGEQVATTDANGDYVLRGFDNGLPGLKPGTYTVAEVPQAGWEQIYPTGDVPTYPAGDLTVPGQLEAVEGDYSSAYPFNIGSSGQMRYQQIYSSSDFPGGGVIDEIRYRLDDANGEPFSASGIDLRISLGHAATTVATASETFANNIGPGYVTVFDGLLDLSSSESGSPSPFDIIIDVPDLFEYDPARGDLLLDILMRHTPGTEYFDASSDAQQSTTTRIWTSNPASPTGSVGWDGDFFGLVTQFRVLGARPGTDTVLLGPGQHVTGVDFGNFAYSTVQGMKWDDVNANGVKDTGESALSGWRIYVDLNDDGAFQAGEPTDVTDAGGAYSIQNVPPGTYRVCEQMQSGWVQTFPAVGYHEITFISGSGFSLRDFGNRYLLDFGDAPAPYPTMLGDDGARHLSVGPRLGAHRDGETDGQPTASADGDDTHGTPDDEDGVILPVLIVSMLNSTAASLTVDLQNPDASSNCLDAWIDFNQDGDWDDPGEQIFASYDLGTTVGVRALNFTVPRDLGGNIVDGVTYARFRLSSAGGLLPTGPAVDGEVEDYPVVISPLSSPRALADNSVSDDSPQLVTDGSGNWVAVWESEGEIQVSRSTDAGLAWTAPTSLDTTGCFPHVATDGAGNWVVVWASDDTLGGTIDGDYDILISRSTDAGLNWTPAEALNSSATSDSGIDLHPRVTTDGAGNWIVLWETEGDGENRMLALSQEILVSCSNDAGVSWTAPVSLTPTDKDWGNWRPQVATDGAGNWVAVWYSNDDLAGMIGSDYDILVSRSGDAGLTWTDPAPLNANAFSDSGYDYDPRIATDAGGNWVVVWTSDDSLDGTIGTDFDILVSRSTDAGLTWTIPLPLNTNAASDVGEDQCPQVTTDGADNWVTVWHSNDGLRGTIGADDDVLVSRSYDAGATWTDPAPLNANAALDSGSDLCPQAATDGLGNWVTVWQSNDPLEGTVGSDYDIFYAKFSDNLGHVGAQLVAVTAPSTTGFTELPSGVETVALGSTYYVEVWVQDRLVPGVGITGGKVDVGYTTAVVDGVGVVNQDFDLLPDGVIDDPNGVVQDLGGGTLEGGRGVEPQWARLAYVEFVAAELGEATFQLSPGAMQFGRFGGGNVDWSLVDLGTPVVVEQVGRTRIDMTVVDQPSVMDDKGEVATLPASADWVHEWQSFWVEIWVSTPDTTAPGVAEATVDLQYFTTYATAQEIVYGPAFTRDQTGTIDDGSGQVRGIGGRTERNDVGDDAYVLLARVRFTSAGTDQVPVNQAGRNMGPYDMQMALTNGQTVRVDDVTVVPEWGASPATELWAVMYDIDDNNGIDFGDLSFFAAAFGRTVGAPDSEPPYAWWADFDRSGRVDFGDLAFFAPNFHKNRSAIQSGTQTLVFPASFPAAWRTGSGTGGEGEPAQIPTVFLDALPGTGVEGFARPAGSPAVERITAMIDDAFAELGAQRTERWTASSRPGVRRQPDGLERVWRLPRLDLRWESLEDALSLLAEAVNEPNLDGVSILDASHL